MSFFDFVPPSGLIGGVLGGIVAVFYLRAKDKK